MSKIGTPLVCHTINGHLLYDKVSRDCFHSAPYHFRSRLRLYNLEFPELLFQEQFDQIKHIVKVRKRRLAAKDNLQTVNYQPGNIVLTHDIPTSNQPGSKELKPTAENIYYVKRTSPTHLRLIHLFNGAERSVPKEYITKLNISDLAMIRFSLENHHLSAVHDRLQ